MKKIMITIGKLDRGGAEMRILRLISDLNTLNISARFYIYVVSGEKGVLTSLFLDQKNIEIVYGKKGILGLNFFLDTLKKIQPDILHINASLAGGIYAFVGKLAKIPLVYCHIRTTEHYGDGLIYHLKQKLFTIFLNNFSDKVIGVCHGARKLSKTSNEKWITIYNGIDIAFDNLDSEFRLPYSLVCLGRMHEAKNQIFLADVLKELLILEPNIDWKIYLYGRENLEIKSQISAKINKLNIEKHLFFCGETNQPLEVLKKFDLLILPSIREGLPGVVLEAVSVGCQAIVSNLDGCQEIAEKIPYVHVVENYDSKLWAKEVVKFYKNSEYLSKIKIQDSLRGSDFDNYKHVENICKLWGVNSNDH